MEEILRRNKKFFINIINTFSDFASHANQIINTMCSVIKPSFSLSRFSLFTTELRGRDNEFVLTASTTSYFPKQTHEFYGAKKRSIYNARIIITEARWIHKLSGYEHIARCLLWSGGTAYFPIDRQRYIVRVSGPLI